MVGYGGLIGGFGGGLVKGEGWLGRFGRGLGGRFGWELGGSLYREGEWGNNYSWLRCLIKVK